MKLLSKLGTAMGTFGAPDHHCKQFIGSKVDTALQLQDLLFND